MSAREDDEVDKVEKRCPDCGQPHSGSNMQQPGGYSGCQTCGWCA